MNLTNSFELYSYLNNYNDLNNNNLIKNSILTSITKKIFTKTNNIYSKIHFLESIVDLDNIKKFICDFFSNNKHEAKLYLIKNVILSPQLNDILIKKYVDCICMIFNFNYYLLLMSFGKLFKEIIYEFKYKSQNIDIDLGEPFNDEHTALLNLTVVSIELFNKIEKKKLECSFINKNNIYFDFIFKLVIRLLDYGLINYMEELNMRLKEINYIVLDIIHFEAKNTQLKQELNEENKKDNLIEISINNEIIRESKIKKKIVKKRIKDLKFINNFYSISIPQFIKWTVNLVNTTIINENTLNTKYSNIYLETLLNIILTFKNSMIIDIHDNDYSLIQCIYNLNNNKLIKNDSIFIKSLEFLKIKHSSFKENKYITNLFIHDKYWCKVLIEKSIVMKNNEEFLNFYFIFICDIFNELIKNNKCLLTYLSHVLRNNELKKFINLVLKNFKNNVSVVLKLYYEIYSSDDTILDSIFYTDKYVEFFEFYKMTMSLSKFLNNIIEVNKTLIYSYENRNLYFEIIDKFVEKVGNISEKIIINSNFSKLIRHFNKLITNIFLHNYKGLINIYSVEFLEFKKNNWVNYISVLNKIQLYHKYIVKSVINNMETIIKYNINKFSKLDNKFIDPITQTIIEEPVILYNDIIVDKYVICKYLIDNEYNPFNREYLTIDILEKNNSDKQNLAILNNFKLDFQIEYNKIKI